MDLGKTIFSLWTFLKENWVIVVGVGAATFLVRSVSMILVNIAYARIVRQIKDRGKTSLGMSPVSIDRLKEMVEHQHDMLAWILSRKYVLAECFARLKDEGVIFWSDELKTYCFSSHSGRLN
jgi:hypothetical protein